MSSRRELISRISLARTLITTSFEYWLMSGIVFPFVDWPRNHFPALRAILSQKVGQRPTFFDRLFKKA